MLEKEWDEEDQDPVLDHTYLENQSIQELAEEALKSEEEIQRIIMNDNNQ